MELILFTLSRVLHVGTAIVLVGGTIFVRFILMPSANEALDQATHDKLRNRIMGTWKRVVHAGIALLLLSGGFNFWRTIAFGPTKVDSLYHALMGTKIVLALVVFFIASALVGRSAAFEGMRKNAKKWLAINILLATIIVAISGFLRVRGPTSSAAKVASPPSLQAAE